jgi:hypothetical protein
MPKLEEFVSGIEDGTIPWPARKPDQESVVDISRDAASFLAQTCEEESRCADGTRLVVDYDDSDLDNAANARSSVRLTIESLQDFGLVSVNEVNARWLHKALGTLIAQWDDHPELYRRI